MSQLFKKLLFCCIGLFLTNMASSQSCANYTVSRSTGISYVSISGTGSEITSWRNTVTPWNYADNRSYQYPIGFDFFYLGTRYTQFSLSADGFIDFSSSTNDGSSNAAPYGLTNTYFTTAAGTRLAIAAMYDDFTSDNQGATPLSSNIKYLVSGTEPNRVLTVEWINLERYTITDSDVNFQIKLYETTGIIEMVYGTMTQGTGTWSYSCGINALAGSSGNALYLLEQQTANSTTFSSTAQDNLTTIPASNSRLTFTPPTPNAPTALSFTSVGKTGMTLNWADNASNENGYAVYNSTDNVIFTYANAFAANAITGAITGLSPNTTYYWKVYAMTEGRLSSALTGTQATTVGTTFTSVASTGWSVSTTWDCNCGAPTAGDNVIIANGTTVTLDANGSCYNLTVGQGTSGQLTIGNSGTARTLIVGNNITVANGGTMITGGTNATHLLNISGNISNSGTFDLGPSTTRIMNTTFNKNGNQTISGSGGTTRMNKLTINMGTSNTNVLEVSSSNFAIANTDFLTLTNGTFKLSSATATLTPFTAATTISSTAGLWINNSSATLSFGASITLRGYIRATAGTLNIGNAADENLSSDGGTIIVDGGTVNISGRLDRLGAGSRTFFTMSAGTLTVATSVSTAANLSPFHISEALSTFNWSNGTIIIRNRGNGNSGFLNTGGTIGSVTGGTLQIGDASTTAGQTIQINSSVNIPALTVGTSVAVTAQLATNLTIVNDVTITMGTLNVNGLDMTVGGNWSRASAAVFTPGTRTVTLNGSGSQTIGGTAASETFYNLIINKTAGQLVSTTGSIATITIQDLTQTQGNFTPPATLNINGNYTLTDGTFTAGTTINIQGNWTHAVAGTAVFTPGTNTVNFTSTSATQTINGTKTFETFYNIGIAKTGQILNTGGSVVSITTQNCTITSGTLTAPATLNINGNMVISGTLTAGAATNISGDWTHNTGGVFTHSSGTVNFINGNSQVINGTLATAETFYNLVINKTTSTTVTQSLATVTVNNRLTMTDGTFITGANVLNGTGGITATGGDLQIGQQYTTTPGLPQLTGVSTAYAITGGTITFNCSTGGGNQTIRALNTSGSAQYYHIVLGGSGTKTADGNMTMAGNWTNNGVTFAGVTFTTSFRGTGAQTIGGTAASETFYHVVVNKTSGQLLSATGSIATITTQDLTQTQGNFTPPATLNINGNYTLTDGTLTAGTTINVVGNWTHAAAGTAVFTPGANTVNFTSTTATQTINGTKTSETFYHLGIAKTGRILNTGGSVVTITTQNCTITAGTLTAPATLNINGNLTIGGTATLTAGATTNISGDWTHNTGGVFNHSNGTVNFTNGNAQVLGGTLATAATFFNLVLNKTTATTLTQSLAIVTVNNRLTMTDGIFNTGANILNGTGGITATGGDLQIGEQYTTTPGLPRLTGVSTIYAVTGGTITFNCSTGGGNQRIRSLNTSGSAQYYHIVLGGSGTKTADGSMTIAGNWTNNGVTFAGVTFTTSFRGTGAQTIGGTAASETFYHVIVNKTSGQLLSATGSIATITTQDLTQTQGNFTPPATLNINGNYTLTDGTLTAGTTINVVGNWTHAATGTAVFTPGTNTVNFTSTAATQTINGTKTSETFYHVGIAKTAQILNTGGSVTTITTQNCTITSGTLTAPATLNFNGNLVIAASGTLTAGTNTNISGDWTKNTTGTFTHNNGTVTFNGSGSHTLGGTTSSTFYNIVVNTSASSDQVQLGIATFLSNVLTLTRGCLDLSSGYSFTITNGASSAISSTANGWVKSENANVTGKIIWNITGSGGPYIFPFGYDASTLIPITLTVNSATNLTSFGAATYRPAVYDVNMPPGVTHVYDLATGVYVASNCVQRFWQFDPTWSAGTSINADITINAAAAEVTGLGGSDIAAQRWNGLDWDSPNAGQTSSTTSTTVSGVTSFSPWAATKSGSPLPIELMSFDAHIKENKTVEISWVTASEINNNFFTVERSSNGNTFETLERVKGAGNSAIKLNYKTIDNYPLVGTSYYRLKQTDFDGHYSYSDIKVVSMLGSSLKFGVYPNPVNSGEIINIVVPDLYYQSLQLTMTDISGKVYFSKTLNTEDVKRDNNVVKINERFSSGIYLITILLNNKIMVEKILIQ